MATVLPHPSREAFSLTVEQALVFAGRTLPRTLCLFPPYSMTGDAPEDRMQTPCPTHSFPSIPNGQNQSVCQHHSLFTSGPAWRPLSPSRTLILSFFRTALLPDLLCPSSSVKSWSSDVRPIVHLDLLPLCLRPEDLSLLRLKHPSPSVSLPGHGRKGCCTNKVLSSGLGIIGWGTALSALCQGFLKVDHHEVGKTGVSWVPCLGGADVFGSRPQVEEEHPGTAP